MAERHVVLFFSLLAEYQGKCHSCIPLNTNFRHRRQPATPSEIFKGTVLKTFDLQIFLLRKVSENFPIFSRRFS